jgi:hypothetical protein
MFEIDAKTSVRNEFLIVKCGRLKKEIVAKCARTCQEDIDDLDLQQLHLALVP